MILQSPTFCDSMQFMRQVFYLYLADIWKNISEVAESCDLSGFFFNRQRREKNTPSREKSAAKGREKRVGCCQEILNVAVLSDVRESTEEESAERQLRMSSSRTYV